MTANEPVDKSQLFKSISEVMAVVDRIPKNGFNDFHKYHFATEADVSDALRKELASRDVAVFVSNRIVGVKEWLTPRGKPTLLTNVECEVTFACGKSGATFSVTATGTGDDPSDKGTYKAITGAVKYALLKTFLVPTGDDPENDQVSSDGGGRAIGSGAGVRQGQGTKRTGGAAPARPGAPVPKKDGYVFAFGKHRGVHIEDVPADYLVWLMDQPPSPTADPEQREKAHKIYRTELDRRDNDAA